MKKKVLAIVAAGVLLFAVVGAGVVIWVRNSPEYALLAMVQDVQASGLEGLKPHLAGEVREAVDKIDTLSENVVFDAIFSALDADSYIELLKAELAQVKWSLNDVRKDFQQATILLEFNYENKLTGSMELTMVREDGVWKICEIGMPNFDHFEW